MKSLRKGPVLWKEAQRRRNKPVVNVKGSCIFIVYYGGGITTNVSIFSVPLARVGVGGV